MNSEEIERLKFRNQYILVPHEIDCPFLNQVTSVANNYRLYTHIDLSINSTEKETRKIILIGNIFDYRSPQKENSTILKELVNYDFENLLLEVNEYTGRYVIIHIDSNHFKVLHDTMSARKVYYTNPGKQVSIASQPALLASVLGLKKTENKELLRYYASDNFRRLNNSNIGDYTMYDGIKQLLPNHYLDVHTNKSIRYWPNKRLEYKSVKDIAKTCSLMIKGYLTSIVKRHQIMLPVTAGKDSRILLAATRQFTDRVFYYINHEERMSLNNPDIAVPRKILQRLNLEFNILKPAKNIDPDFQKIYFQNNEYASTAYLPFIYNYYRDFRNKINIPGNIASAGFEVYKNRYLKVTGKSLANLNHLSEYGIAVSYYEKWHAECHEICKASHIHILNLFYWEERLANWGTQIQMEKDIAQEDINPFNSRKLVELFLSVHPRYISYPFFRLHKIIIKNLWPEVLMVPINPGRRTTILKITKVLGLLDIYNFLKDFRNNR